MTVREARTVTCTRCGADRETRANGGIPIKCPACGDFFVPPPRAAGTQPTRPPREPQGPPRNPKGSKSSRASVKFSDPVLEPVADTHGSDQGAEGGGDEIASPPPAEPKRGARFGPRARRR